MTEEGGEEVKTYAVPIEEANSYDPKDNQKSIRAQFNMIKVIGEEINKKKKSLSKQGQVPQ